MSKAWKDRIIAVALILGSIYLWNQALEFPERGGVFPIFSFIIIILCAVILFFSTFSAKRSSPAIKAEQAKFGWSDAKPYLLLLLTLIMALLFEVLGYFFTTGVFLILSSLVLGTRKYRTLFLTALILFPLLYAFLIHGIQAVLPKGVLF